MGKKKAIYWGIHKEICKDLFYNVSLEKFYQLSTESIYWDWILVEFQDGIPISRKVSIEDSDGTVWDYFLNSLEKKSPLEKSFLINTLLHYCFFLLPTSTFCCFSFLRLTLSWGSSNTLKNIKKKNPKFIRNS